MPFAKSSQTVRGFTLMEVLVVLVIVGLVSTLLFQMFGQMGQIYTSLNREVQNIRNQDLEAEWFRQLVAGLIPDFSDGKSIFKGQSKEFSGLTTNPVGTNYGSLVAFRLILRFNQETKQTELRFLTNNRDLLLSAWAEERGEFAYYDAKGEPHDQWPPVFGLFPPMPKAISLTRPDTRPSQENSVVWFGAIAATEKPLPRPRDIFKGL